MIAVDGQIWFSRYDALQIPGRYLGFYAVLCNDKTETKWRCVLNICGANNSKSQRTHSASLWQPVRACVGRRLIAHLSLPLPCPHKESNCFDWQKKLIKMQSTLSLPFLFVRLLLYIYIDDNVFNYTSMFIFSDWIADFFMVLISLSDSLFLMNKKSLREISFSNSSIAAPIKPCKLWLCREIWQQSGPPLSLRVTIGNRTLKKKRSEREEGLKGRDRGRLF